MANVLTFDSLDLACRRWFSGVFALESLHTGFLVGTDNMNVLFFEFGGLMIGFAYLFNGRLVFFRFLKLIFRGQPIPTLVWPDIVFFR